MYNMMRVPMGRLNVSYTTPSMSDVRVVDRVSASLPYQGREPFIRMKIFLEDGESIPKLVASQYRIPPDKLLRSNSVTDSTGTGKSEPLTDALCFVGLCRPVLELREAWWA